MFNIFLFVYYINLLKGRSTQNARVSVPLKKSWQVEEDRQNKIDDDERQQRERTKNMVKMAIASAKEKKVHGQCNTTITQLENALKVELEEQQHREKTQNQVKSAIKAARQRKLNDDEGKKQVAANVM